MDYQQFRVNYSFTLNNLNKQIDALKIQANQKRLNYIHELESLGLKPGTKVKILVPEKEYNLVRYSQTLFGYIDQILVSTTVYEDGSSGYVSLKITLPGKTGNRMMRGRRETKIRKDLVTTYPYVQPEWITLLPEDFDFTKDPEAKRFLELLYTS